MIWGVAFLFFSQCSDTNMFYVSDTTQCRGKYSNELGCVWDIQIQQLQRHWICLILNDAFLGIGHDSWCSSWSIFGTPWIIGIYWNGLCQACGMGWHASSFHSILMFIQSSTLSLYRQAWDPGLISLDCESIHWFVCMSTKKRLNNVSNSAGKNGPLQLSRAEISYSIHLNTIIWIHINRYESLLFQIM